MTDISPDMPLEEVVVKVRRSAKVVKGGKRFSFSALVVVGDRKGTVGWGYAGAKEVPFAVEKAIKDARKNLVKIPLKDTTIPHRIVHKYRASTVLLRPAARGTGVIAGAPVRAVLDMAGVRDALTKVSGSANPINVVKAVFGGLQCLRGKKYMERLRGVSVV